MVTCVNGMVVCRICWLAVLAKKSVIWLGMPRVSFGPALLKLLKRSPPPPVLVVNATVGAASPAVAPHRHRGGRGKGAQARPGRASPAARPALSCDVSRGRV